MKDSLRLILMILAFIIGISFISSNNLFGLLVMVIMIFLISRSDKQITFNTSNGKGVFHFRELISWIKTHEIILLMSSSYVYGFLAAWLNHLNVNNKISPFLWFFAILCLAFSTWNLDKRQISLINIKRKFKNVVQDRECFFEITAIFVLTLIAFVLRSYNLLDYPPSFHGDEGEMGVISRSILTGSQTIPLFVTSWFDHPTLFFYIQAASMAIFGDNIVGLRMLSAIFGSACIPLIYAIGKTGWNRLVGMVAAWLMVVSHICIHYSRLGLNNIESTFFMMLSVYLLIRFWKKADHALNVPDGTFRKNWKAILKYQFQSDSMDFPYTIFGIFIGLSQYFYFGSKLILVCIIPLMLVMLFQKKIILRHILFSSLAAMVVFAPLGWFYADHLVTFTGRATGVSMFLSQNINTNIGQGASANFLQVISNQIQKNLLFFVKNGDASTFYLQEISGFDRVTSILFWLGFGISLTQIKRFPNLCNFLWFSLGLLFAGILTNNAPNGPRLIVMVPSIFIFGGIFVDRFYSLVKRTIPIQTTAIAIPILIGMIIYTSYTNINYYFVVFEKQASNMVSITLAKQMVKYRNENTDIYLIGAPIIYANHGTIRFVVGEGKVKDLDDITKLPKPGTNQRGILILAVIPKQQELISIMDRFPEGVFSSGADNAGRELYVSYYIPPVTSPN